MPTRDDPGDIYSLKPTEGVLNLPPEMQAIVRSKGGLNILMEQVPPAHLFEEEAERFKALSSPVRIQILHALVTADLCPSILKNITGMSDSKLSYHLEILESAGFITHLQRQKWRIYVITVEGRKTIGHERQPSDIPIL
ncbi:MAG: winged helix-turn-helix transcriptional regulator [Candidatus Methanomethylophilus sp.]|jgi:ArsR family transcriptional regulator|nr:winged helix-turn-helix transcriptional regulator [Methanomethylophilus sp.]MBQ4368158.1 winged helix-turn-helix transcriptional regulator [Methanomethylophilus sp.]MBQ4411489.1 winged helix-turn-helix transcriptional regulator [Methanomethylophilus sp.]MBQ5447974.1 winged helix-turn-helix transcriptional regulator [Methanomethylophilus sp.]MBQ5483821.1 winged helix-turn-helix transcriptional regulator [Methanomethylophilus sp.]